MMERMFSAQVPTVAVSDVPVGAYLLDVREPDEWADGHAPGAHHLPMYEIPARLDEIPTEGDVVLVCRVGGRSAQVTGYLISRGWTNVSNLAGGMVAWEAAGRPVQGTAAGATGTVR